MFRAIDNNGNSVLIWEADSSKSYYCPICHNQLIQRRGKIKAPHFSHSKGDVSKGGCLDKWKYDPKTEWHLNWQNRFPKECIEKIIEIDGQKHIADVQINDYVIEFQHSSITPDSFQERNSFYSKAGYKTVWVFDLSFEWENNKISQETYPKNKYTWSYAKKVFRDMNLKTANATIYFQFVIDYEETDIILEKVIGGYYHFSEFYTDISHCLSASDFVKRATDGKLVPKKANDYPQPPDYIEGGSSIYELWRTAYSFIIVKNIFSNEEMLIQGKDGKISRKYNDPYDHIIGKYSTKLSDGTFKYSEPKIVWNAEKRIWQLIKCKLRKS